MRVAIALRVCILLLVELGESTFADAQTRVKIGVKIREEERCEANTIDADACMISIFCGLQRIRRCVSALLRSRFSLRE